MHQGHRQRRKTSNLYQQFCSKTTKLLSSVVHDKGSHVLSRIGRRTSGVNFPFFVQYINEIKVTSHASYLFYLRYNRVNTRFAQLVRTVARRLISKHENLILMHRRAAKA